MDTFVPVCGGGPAPIFESAHWSPDGEVAYLRPEAIDGGTEESVDSPAAAHTCRHFLRDGSPLAAGDFVAWLPGAGRNVRRCPKPHTLNATQTTEIILLALGIGRESRRQGIGGAGNLITLA